jgi:hypothetical protein
MRTQIILVGCGKAKQTAPGWHGPAEDLYTGSLFQARKHFAKSCISLGDADRWFIISAKHQLLSPQKQTYWYNKKLSDLSPANRREWAILVAHQLIYEKNFKDRFHRPLEPHKTTIIIHAGADYTKHLAPILEALGYGVIWPVKGMSQGAQLAWYAGIRKMNGETLTNG